MPLISLSTVVVLLVVSEVAARAIWPEQLSNTCRRDDAEIGVRYKPNCSTVMKTPEGPWHVSAYNECGYRSEASCRPLPAGHRRIALLGSSLSEGYLVPYQQTIAAGIETDLTRSCGAPVEVQNLGALAAFGDQLLLRMDEALRLHPSAVLLVVAPFDFEEDLAPAGGRSPPTASLSERVIKALRDSRTLAMTQHFLFRDPSIYLPLYLRYGDRADFLRPPFTKKWRERLQVLDRIVANLAARAHHANVPFALVFVPQEAQVALIGSGRTVPPGIDPMALQKAIAPMAARDGLSFIDTSVALRDRPAPERLYYQVDGHLSGDGQPIAAAYIARQLAGAKEGPFATCRGTVAASVEVTR
jgi:hypothetical protein